MEHKLYVIEGLDGSGKATQATLLTDYLTGKGIPCRKLSFPDYNDPSSTLVKMYLHGEIGTLEEVNPYGASLFFTVDRYASYCRHWRPDYEAGKILVADRYSTSNIPHQMSRLPKEEWDSFLDWLCDVEYNKAGLPRPTAVVYLDVDPEVSRRLLSERYHGDESKRDIHEADFAWQGGRCIPRARSLGQAEEPQGRGTWPVPNAAGECAKDFAEKLSCAGTGIKNSTFSRQGGR